MTIVSIDFQVKNPQAVLDEDAPEELTYSADVNITSFGSGPSWTYYGGDPGDPPEWEIDHIYDPEGNEIPYKIAEVENPEWQTLANLIDKTMEDFDYDNVEYDFDD